MTEPAAQKSSSPIARLLVELGPLVVFYGVYFKGDLLFDTADKEIFYATGAFMAAFALAFGYSAIIERRIAPMLLVTGVIVAIFGGLTLILQNQTFIYMKPTMVNLTFAAILGGGLATGRLFMKNLFAHAFQLHNAGWRALTLRFIGFFIFLAILNEVIWRNFSEPFWVSFKTFGVLPLTLLFTFAQLPFIAKHQPPATGERGAADADDQDAAHAVEPADAGADSARPDARPAAGDEASGEPRA